MAILVAILFGDPNRHKHNFVPDSVSDIDFFENKSETEVSNKPANEVNIANRLYAQLTEKFSSIKIRRVDLDRAEQKLKGELFDNYSEKVNGKN